MTTKNATSTFNCDVSKKWYKQMYRNAKTYEEAKNYAHMGGFTSDMMQWLGVKRKS